MLEIRQAIPGDVDAVHAFLGRAYGALARYKGPDRWQWQFAKNPYRPPGSGIPVWIAKDGHSVVGQIAVQWGVAQTPGGPVPIGWIVDVIVLPEYRGQSLGHRLYQAVAQDVAVLVTLTMAPATRRMAERLGAITLGPVWQLNRLVAPTAAHAREYAISRTQHHRRVQAAALYATNLWGSSSLLALGGRAAAACSGLRARLTRSDATVRVEPVHWFGIDVDELWRRLGGHHAIAAPRTSQFMNWRFAECPGLKYERFMAFRGEDVVGCLVLRRCLDVEHRLGVIAELLASTEDAPVIAALTNYAIRHFGGGISAVECGTSSPYLAKHLRALGFIRTRTFRPTVVCREAADRRFFEAHHRDWFMSKADHDWDQVHLTWSAGRRLETAGGPPRDVPNGVAEAC